MRHDGDTLVALASALAGAAAPAARLVAEVEALAPATLGREDELDGPDRAQRTLLVQRSLRRPPRGERVVGLTEDDQQEVPEQLRDVQREISRLPPLPRAVLVLRHLEHLTVLEIAQLTERPPAGVNRALEAATTTVAAEPYLVEQALAAAPRPEPWQVQAAAAELHRRRRRTRGRGVLAALAAVALVAAAVVVPPLLEPDPYTRGRGEWVYSVTLPPDGAFQVSGRSLTADEEVLVVDRAGSDRLRCSVTVTTAAQATVTPPGRRTKVGHREARFTDDGSVWWSLGPRTSAAADCEQEEVADRSLLELARLVRLGPVPVLLPFTLPGLLEGQQLNRIYDYEQFHGASVAPAGTDEVSGDGVLVGVPTFFPMPEDRRPRTVDVNGATGTVIRETDGQWVCWPVDGQHTCVGSINQAQRPPDASQLDRLIAVARGLRMAADLRDRDTWFDAREALPR